MKGRRSTASAAFAAALAILAATLGASCARKLPEGPFTPADYASWRKTTDLRLDYPIPGHEDRLRTIYMNATGFSARPTERDGKWRWDFPAGTIIAKDMHETADPAPGSVPIRVTTMVKAPDDPRAQGGWLWVVKDLGTGVETVMTGNFCVGCHSNANEAHPYGDRNPGADYRDYVFFVPGAAAPGPTASESGGY